MIFPFKIKLFNHVPTFLPEYFRFRKAVKEMRDIADSIIGQSLKIGDQELNLVKFFLKEYSNSSEARELLMDEVVTFLLAGHETTAALMVNVVVFLSLNPLVYQQLYNEIKEVLGNNYPSYDDLTRLKYTKAVIQETLRLRSPASCFSRCALDDDVIFNHTLKRGDFILISNYASQRIAAYWENPEAFNPNRFMTTLTKEQQLTYLPFGAGKHMCLGSQFATMEAMLMLVMIMQRYRLELTPGCILKRDQGLVNRWSPELTVHVKSAY